MMNDRRPCAAIVRGAIVALLLAFSAGAQEGDRLGSTWHGTDDDQWDFRMVRERDNEFSWEATHRGNGRSNRGNVVVDLFRRKLKLARTIGGFLTICDGMFSGDSKFVSGVCYGSQGETYWWATIQRGDLGARPGKVNINTATVAELEGWLGLEPAVARRIIESKLRLGAFSNPSNLLEGRILSPDVYESIRTRIAVK